MDAQAEKLTAKDVSLCRAFRSIILKGKYEVQGEACSQVGALFRWFDTLDKKIEGSLAAANETIRKDLGEPGKAD